MTGWGKPAPRGSSASRDEYRAFLSSQSRLRQWRAKSRAFAVIDTVGVVAGAAVCTITAVDVASTWQSSRPWLDHQHLSAVMGAILIPGWVWLMASILLTSPVRKRTPLGRRQYDPVAEARRAESRMLRRNMYPGGWTLAAQIVFGVLCLGFVVAGFASGAAKGSGYVLPGPHYRIQTVGLNDGAWTDVTPAQYAYWQTRFVRLDALFALFGAVMVFLGLGALRLHRTATTQTPEPSEPSDATGTADHTA